LYKLQAPQNLDPTLVVRLS